jgi:hypothetical protein
MIGENEIVHYVKDRTHQRWKLGNTLADVLPGVAKTNYHFLVVEQ